MADSIDSEPDTSVSGSTPTRRLFWPIIVIAVVVVLVDQLTKWWAISALSGGGNTPILGNLLSFQLVYNAGAAFSTGVGFTWIFTIVAGVVAVFVGWLSWRVGSKAWAVGLGLVLGGATTHFGDRLLRPPSFGNGHVVDFINYAGFFIGNVADIAIVVGVAILLVTILRGIHLSGEAAVPATTPDPANPKESTSPE
jgi:signal peptidase II